ncbi:MAG TPA: glutamine synthetase type III, partial [bacterium]|nr:glutamine synthetase type III [bacterium]
REEIFWERYVKVCNIEALAVTDIAKNMIFPAAIQYQAELSGAIKSSEGISSVGQTAGKKALDMTITDINKLFETVEKLMKIHASAEGQDGLPKKAEHYKDEVLPAMLEVRAVVDGMETYVSDAIWPLPKYREMLFQY